MNSSEYLLHYVMPLLVAFSVKRYLVDLLLFTNSNRINRVAGQGIHAFATFIIAITFIWIAMPGDVMRYPPAAAFVFAGVLACIDFIVRIVVTQLVFIPRFAKWWQKNDERAIPLAATAQLFFNVVSYFIIFELLRA